MYQKTYHPPSFSSQTHRISFSTISSNRTHDQDTPVVFLKSFDFIMLLMSNKDPLLIFIEFSLRHTTKSILHSFTQ